MANKILKNRAKMQKLFYICDTLNFDMKAAYEKIQNLEKENFKYERLWRVINEDDHMQYLIENMNKLKFTPKILTVMNLSLA